MIHCKRTDSENKDFINLVSELDADLRIRDGDDHAFYAQFNKTSKIKTVIVAYDGDLAVGCGAIREFSVGTMEVKRMYVKPDQRGKGAASAILRELEYWALELNFSTCVLETGARQPEAIALYHKNDYKRIANYGQYQDIGNSLCFEKKLQEPAT